MSARLHIGFGTAATALVTAVIAWGFVVTGSPDTRRQERLDERRVEDLQTIHREIQLLVRDPARPGELVRPLPATLEEAAHRAVDRRVTLLDPETELPYGYRVVDATTYELTATFAAERDADRDVFWNHPASEHTFTIDALASAASGRRPR